MSHSEAMDGRLGQLLTCLLTIQTCFAYQMYQERFPNGKIVPHPCKPNVFWSGVGHIHIKGGGLPNLFGDDFKNNGGIWDETICNKDSDGDGKTNGEELGDPECIWSIGQQPSVVSGLSHPGVCEPITDINKCLAIPDWLNCEDEDFACPAISEAETFKIALRMSEIPIPAKETTYMCNFIELPSDREYHLVANMPYVDNEAVLHHMLLFGCDDDMSNDDRLNTQSECAMLISDSCDSLIAMWAVGSVGICLADEVGFLIGGNKGFRYAVLQVHYHNPELLSGLTDSSGMDIFVTPKLRKFNMGVALIGPIGLQIPPGELSTLQTGKYSSKCSSKYMLGPVNTTIIRHHMHSLGTAMSTKLKRYDEEKEEILAMDKTFYISKFHTLPNPVIIRPGDEISATCEYRSTTRTTTTYYGQASTDEMCFTYLLFYPKENLPDYVMSSLSWRSIDSCDMQSGVLQGCSLLRIYDIDPRDEIVKNINEKCSTIQCRTECKEYIKVLKSTDPCYQGDVYEIRKTNVYLPPMGYIKDLTLKELEFYSRADSCDKDIALENVLKTMGGETGGETGGASEVIASILACFMGLLWNCFL